MNKLLRYSFVALMAMFGFNVNAQEVTIDFSGSTDNWGIGTTKIVEEKSFTYNNLTIKLKGTEGNGYRWYESGNIILGKQGATLTLPAFSFDVERIDVVGTSGASASVKQNIYVADEAVSTETTGAQNVTNEYKIAEGKQVAGTIYTLKVNSNHNTQITKILIWKKGTSSETPQGTVKFTKITNNFTAGKRYLIVATKDDKLMAAMPVASNNKYGYLNVKEVTDDNGVVMMNDDSYAFTFEAATGGCRIKQGDGRYLYMDATHTSFQVAAEPTEGDIWDVQVTADNTYVIKNVLREKWIQLDASYGTYGSYNEEKGSVPYLYLIDENSAHIDAIKSKTEKGAIYNLAGQRVEKATKGVFIQNGKKFVVK